MILVMYHELLVYFSQEFTGFNDSKYQIPNNNLVCFKGNTQIDTAPNFNFNVIKVTSRGLLIGVKRKLEIIEKES